MKLEDFKARKRTKSVAFPRQIAMYLSRELTDFSLPKMEKNLADEIIQQSFMLMRKFQSLLQTDSQLQRAIERYSRGIKELIFLSTIS